MIVTYIFSIRQISDASEKTHKLEFVDISQRVIFTALQSTLEEGYYYSLDFAQNIFLIAFGYFQKSIFR